MEFLTRGKQVVCTRLSPLKTGLVTSGAIPVYWPMAAAWCTSVRAVYSQAATAVVPVVYSDISPGNTKQLYNICTMLDQRRRRWSNVVQMLYKCFVLGSINPCVHGRGVPFPARVAVSENADQEMDLCKPWFNVQVKFADNDASMFRQRLTTLSHKVVRSQNERQYILTCKVSRYCLFDISAGLLFNRTCTTQ